MGKKGHSKEEILRVLREAESGDTVVEICRKHGISQQAFTFGQPDGIIDWAQFFCASP